MIPGGLYPASVTPFDPNGSLDEASLARLLAHFEFSGCRGVVLAGTNGEGGLLSAVEKRDLIRAAKPLAGSLTLILGLATNSLTEAKWLAVQAEKAGADALLVLPPPVYRRGSFAGAVEWLLAVLNESPLPVILYQNQAVSGFVLPEADIVPLLQHSNCAGLKDSSLKDDDLAQVRSWLRADQCAFVGDERRIPRAMAEGWTGSISGCANVIPSWLADWVEDADPAKTEILLPLLDLLRSLPQPECHKAVLHAFGIIDCPDPRLPLMTHSPEPALSAISNATGIAPGRPQPQAHRLR